MGKLQHYLIIEKMNLNTPVKVIANNSYMWMATWEVDGVIYKFGADYDDDPMPDQDESSWGVVFLNMSEPTRFGIGSSEITGKMGAKALKVFSGVASAFKQFIKDRKPEEFFFTAEEPSRIRLYNRMAKMISQKFNYKLKKYRDEGDSIYEFTRK